MTCLSPLHRNAMLHCVTWQADKKGHDAPAQWDVKPEKFKPCCCLKKPQSSEGGMLHADNPVLLDFTLSKRFSWFSQASFLCLIINHANTSFCFCVFYLVAQSWVPPESLANLCRNPIDLEWLWHGDLSSRSASLYIWDCCKHKQGLFKDHGNNVTCCKSQFKICEGS